MPVSNGEPAVRLAHVVPGRTRLRVDWLSEARRRGDRASPSALGDAVARIPGVRAVEIRAATGSVLCEHGPDLAPDRLLERVADVAAQMAPAGQADPTGPPGPTPTVAAELKSVLAALNARVLTLTEGRLDLATLASLGLVGAGAIHVAVDGKLSFPRWSDLAWWATQTFADFEPAEGDNSKR